MTFTTTEEAKARVAAQRKTHEEKRKPIERIEISHVKYKSKPGSVIHIYWKL